MGALVLFLLITIVLFGAGFAVKALWWLALIMLAFWLIGWVAHGSDRRWYRW